MSTDELLEGMRCVMRHCGGWAARAEGCERYGYGPTPGEAMLQADAARQREERGRPDGYCPVGGSCTNHTECDGSCSPYVARPNFTRTQPMRRALFDDDEEPVTRRKIT